MASERPACVKVAVEIVDGVMLIVLQRPEARNAVDHETADLLVQAVERLDADDALRVGVLTGAGRGFSAGMDLGAFLADGAPAALERFLREGSRKPLVAAVEGFALAGGLELVLACDLAVAAADARFGIPEVKVGLFAAGGGLIRLPRRVPMPVAAELALTGEPITADRAYEVGLVNRVVPPGEALATALDIAKQIAANAPLAVYASKALLGAAAASEGDLWQRQTTLAETVFSAEDAREGASAFLEKRAPRWTGT